MRPGPPHFHPVAGPEAERGFALLITVTLLSFVVVLLIGLAVYTRVETAVAGNTQRQEQARQNALLALNVALTQLQKAAGPDQRVSATAEAISGVNGQKQHYTGIWDSTATGSAPLVWLVSGAETGATENVAAVIPSARQAVMVGAKTDGSASAANTVATLQDLTASGVPGAAANAVIGRYAWWVGDQGVKAPVALPDLTNSLTYAPYNSVEARTRVRQQEALGAGAATASGNPAFEPRDANNTSLVAGNKVGAFSQIAFLKNPGNATVGLTQLQQNFQAWSPNNYAVLANTKTGGLRQDLSSDPTLLGAGVQRWLNYPGYMEVPDPTAAAAAAPIPPAPSPNYDASEPVRRRYIMQPPQPGDGAGQSVAPVLSFFLISFNVQTAVATPGPQPLQIRARWAVSLWNPYSAALVPENLKIIVSGFPRIHIDDENPANLASSVPAFPLQQPFLASTALSPNDPLSFSLPWDAGVAAGTSAADRQSWLPGRVYTWLSVDSTDPGDPPAAGFTSIFYPPSYDLSILSGRVRPLAAPPIDSADVCHIDGTATSFLITLVAPRPTGDVTLGTFISPAYDVIHTTSAAISDPTWQFSYVFRLGESIDGAPWLTNAQSDLHSGTVPASAYVVPNGLSPAVYFNYNAVSSPDRLLDRAPGSVTYNEDTPVFELPRAPLLSLGALQHVALVNARPFSIGNSWGMDPAAALQLNAVNVSDLFDGYFFSGLVAGVTPAAVNGALLLPSPTLKVVPRNPTTGAATTLADLQGAPTAHTSKFLLQGSAFNLNSVNSAAWAAVLRGVRFPAPTAFSYLNLDPTTGTAGDTDLLTVQSDSAQFLRFSQSAQETYKAEPGNSGGAAATELFRQGMRTLDATQVSGLAAKIAGLIRAHQSASGPYRSLAEFLGPSADDGFNGQSLLEKAIADAGINASIAEFSSQWLTQGDILTALAPVLFPRSDTFLVRTYGEVVNPATSAVEGQAWAEALLQRVPDYFDPTDPAETAVGDFDAPSDPTDPASTPSTAHQLNKLYGRRFKVISFRWLTRADL